ncbi:MAG: rsbT 2 [Chitinophagaceae bacterium]|nr:rsbT 2 [Chitinophagaceae bacterium]
MVNATHKSFAADDRSYLSLLKKDVHKIAEAAGFDEKKLNAIDIIVAELTSNLLKHASGGEVLAGIVDTGHGETLELVSIDHGPGMADAKKMLEDGNSTTSTLGQGFGSVKRLSDFLDVYSMPGWGTIVIVRVYKNAEKQQVQKNRITIRGLVLAKTGEEVSGDGYYYKISNDYVRILVADGLGHGKEANLAVNEAVRSFKQCTELSPVDIIRTLHNDIRKTRGLVGVVIVYNIRNKQWLMAGVGNISAKLSGAFAFKNFMSYNGIIGHNIPNTMQNQEMEQDEFQQVILCSDGIRSRWDPARYPGIQKHDQAILAAALYKDFGRRTDDMSVIIAKIL